MRTRRSPRNQEILWRALGGDLLATRPIGAASLDSPRIISRRERMAMEREAVKEALRAKVREVLAAEGSK